MKIAIVILNWNGKELLKKFLPKIIRYSNPKYCDIYVVDNASTDDSITFIKQKFSSVKIIQNDNNYGYSKGYNIALKDINTDIFALVNTDIEVTENWLEPIINTFKTEEKTVIIQPKILDFKDKSKFEYAGAGGGFIDKYGYPFCRGRIFNTLEDDKGQYNDVSEIFWASGACFFIRSHIFNQLKGFDNDFFAHQEEIDLCWRAKNLGYIIKYNGKSTVYHIGGATLSASNSKKTYLNFRNSLYNLVKNAPSKNLIYKIIFRLILDGAAGIKFLFEFKPLHTFAIIKAHFSFYINLSNTLRKRKNITIKIKKYYDVNTVVKQYFIHKRKTYSELDNNSDYFNNSRE
ncbi:MAG: glycosyltransferase family 2 protein [Flavobacteriaceae bacterium]|nr:glycosyltransferase family 2 protein [Flavobacteriaceae bacterium]